MRWRSLQFAGLGAVALVLLLTSREDEKETAKGAPEPRPVDPYRDHFALDPAVQRHLDEVEHRAFVLQSLVRVRYRRMTGCSRETTSVRVPGRASAPGQGGMPAAHLCPMASARLVFPDFGRPTSACR